MGRRLVGKVLREGRKAVRSPGACKVGSSFEHHRAGLGVDTCPRRVGGPCFEGVVFGCVRGGGDMVGRWLVVGLDHRNHDLEGCDRILLVVGENRICLLGPSGLALGPVGDRLPWDLERWVCRAVRVGSHPS